MDLDSFLRKSNINKAWMCRQLGICRLTLYRILNGQIPKIQTAQRISDFTEGAVAVWEIMNPELAKSRMHKKRPVRTNHKINWKNRVQPSIGRKK